MMRTDSVSDLLSELRERFAPDADVREVEVYLASRGYDARQIGEILAALAIDLDGPPDAGSPAAGGTSTGDPASTTADSAPRRPEGPTFRVMGAYERTRFAPEAWSHLLALAAGGVLSTTDREHVIERALLQTDGRIGLPELRALLEGAGLEAGGSAGAMTIH